MRLKHKRYGHACQYPEFQLLKKITQRHEGTEKKAFSQCRRAHYNEKFHAYIKKQVYNVFAISYKN